MDSKKVSTGCLHGCNNNVYNFEQLMVSTVNEMSIISNVEQSD